MPIAMFGLSIVTAYLIGSFPTSYILTKIFKGIDIRQVGSKSAGATNVLRTAGKVPAVITLIIDVLKGVLVVTLVTNFFYSFMDSLEYDFYRALLGFIAICGHVWPIFLKFRGGKGVATTLGVGIVIAPLPLLPALAIWLVIFLMTDYVSLASISALISFPIFACFMNRSLYTIIFGVLICLLGTYKHKENIKRLLRREENKTVIFKSFKR